MNKTALVTGASRGLGEELMCRLMKLGYTVLRPSRGHMNLNDEESIADAASGFLKMCPNGKIDVLINNAAVMSENLELSLQVNAIGAHSLTKHLWPLLLRSEDPRVINISSREGLSCNGGWRPYSVSKAALNGVTRMLAQNKEGVMVCACCPGWFRSRMGGDKAPISEKEAADTPIWLATEASKAMNGQFVINREVIPW